MEEVSAQWFALRATYNRSLQVEQVLRGKGIRTFIPMERRRVTRGGKSVWRMMPAVGGLLFARSTQARLYEHIRSEGDRSVTRFIWDRASRLPLTVPEKQMDDFIRVCEGSGEEAVFLGSVDERLRAGARVRVVRGPLSGVEGRIVRLRKSRRVLVELPGLLSVASTYVPATDLEYIGD